MVIEHAIRGADDGFAVAVRIPSHADARLKIILVGLNSFLQSQQVICGKCQSLGWRELGGNLNVVAQRRSSA